MLTSTGKLSAVYAGNGFDRTDSLIIIIIIIDIPTKQRIQLMRRRPKYCK
jgi:hypothetical protein